MLSMKRADSGFLFVYLDFIFCIGFDAILRRYYAPADLADDLRAHGHDINDGRYWCDSLIR